MFSFASSTVPPAAYTPPLPATRAACSIKRLVYGARQPRMGADGSWVALFPPPPAEGGQDPDSAAGTTTTTPGWQDEQAGLLASSRQAYVPHPYHPDIEVVRGVRAEECGAAMRAFFQQRRLVRAAAQQAAPAEQPGQQQQQQAL